MVDCYGRFERKSTRSPLRLPRPVHHAHPSPFTNLFLVPPSTSLLHATVLLFLTARIAHIAFSLLCLSVCFMWITGEISKTFWHVMAAPEISDPAAVLVEGTRHWGHRPSAPLPEGSRPRSELEDIESNYYDDSIKYLILLVTELFRLDLIDLAGLSGVLAQFCRPSAHQRRPQHPYCVFPSSTLPLLAYPEARHRS